MHSHKDSIDFGLREISLAGGGEFVLSQSPKWCGVGIIFDEITWSDNILEAITLGNLSTLLALATNDENSFILLNHFSHRGVA